MWGIPELARVILSMEEGLFCVEKFQLLLRTIAHNQYS
jgi:hypothetical protein